MTKEQYYHLNGMLWLILLFLVDDIWCGSIALLFCLGYFIAAFINRDKP